jgi:hypothetical protein
MTTKDMEDYFKMALVFGSGAAVHYFGIDRDISFLPNFVAYGVAGGVTMYALEHKPNQSGENFIYTVYGAFCGIIGGEAIKFLM